MRTVALYRVSTKGQMAKDSEDIPAQRSIIKEFIDGHQGWHLVNEFTEGGISGFKTKTTERDALQSIKAMAIAGEFDVLVVYMSDRIGRIADETPLVIGFLNAYGVKVWSVVEGEIKSDTHTDKLLTYIRFWQNEGESLKISQRVSYYQKELIKAGRWRGGDRPPLGYQLVDNGSKNEKGKNILDFVIDEEEAEIVKIIFDLSLNLNYGESRITKYLNTKGLKSKKGGSWYQSTVHSILTNPIYKGQFRMRSRHAEEELLSPVQPHLVIIPEEQWDKNRERSKARSNRKNVTKRGGRTKRNHGKLLLNGLAFCGYCGERLTTMTAYNQWTLKDGTQKKVPYHKYRCSSFYKKGAVDCDGQSQYSRRIEDIVVDETKTFLFELSKNRLNEELMRNFTKNIGRLEKEKTALKAKATENLKEINILKDEIPKSLQGTSNFKPEVLSELFESKEKKQKSIMEDLQQKDQEIEKARLENTGYFKLSQDIHDWESKFDTLDLDGKKAMLDSVIEKVTVSKDNIDIIFKVRLETFRNSTLTPCKSEQGVRVLR